MPSTRTRRPSGRLIAWLALVVTLAALGYASRLSGAETPDDIAYRWSSSIGALIQYGIMVGILLLISRGLPRREAFGLRRPRSWGRALLLTAGALLMIWAVGGVLSQFLDSTSEQGYVPDEWDAGRAGAFVSFFLVVAVLGPVVEELTFRGLGFGLVAAPYGALAAVLVTGILFGLVHGLLVALPILAFFGIVVGWLRARTASVYPPMLLHTVFNASALIVSVTLLG
jgi:membrane protease YdiL (CAAX protease family)